MNKENLTRIRDLISDMDMNEKELPETIKEWSNKLFDIYLQEITN